VGSRDGFNFRISLAALAQWQSNFFNLRPLLILTVVDKSRILNVCQCPKSPEKNVFFAVKKHHGRDINIAAMHAKLNINISLMSENGRPEK